MTYRPLSVRESTTAPAYDGPHDGVPAWLRPSLWNWARGHILGKTAMGPYPKGDVVRAIERMARRQLDWSGDEQTAFTMVESLALADDEFLLDVVDFLLSESRDAESPRALEKCLLQAGSVFTVEMSRTGGGQLCRRVSPDVRAVVEKAVATSDRAGAHLRRAWTMAYGRTPDPSGGFKEAVRAVETVACSVVIPKDTVGTLGKVITRMKDAPHQFRIDLTPSPGFDAIGAVRGMCELLWKSQFDRHGTADESVPLTVSQAECETALHLAATLVHWFATGRVTLVS